MNQRTYDPRGMVEAQARSLAPRIAKLDGARLAVLDNSKWNASRLLKSTVAVLGEMHKFAAVNYYCKGSFSRNAEPEIIEAIAANNDIALVAIAD